MARSWLVALNDRRVRIEVGYGIEGALPDATANRIIQQDIVPQFKRGDYYGGISTGVDRIMRVIEGEPLPDAGTESARAGRAGPASRCCRSCSFSRWSGGSILRRMFGRVGGALATGGVVGFLTWLLISLLGISVVAGIVAFIFSLAGGMGGGPGGGGSGWYSRRHGSGLGLSGRLRRQYRWWRVRGRRLRRWRWRLRWRRRLGRVVMRVEWRRLFRHLCATRRKLERVLPVANARGDRAGDYGKRTHARRRDTIRVEARSSRAKSGPGKQPRQRALEVFAALGVWDTEANNGVLIYVLLADRDVEIVADRGLNGHVGAAEWSVVCEAMETAFRAGHYERGAVAGVQRGRAPARTTLSAAAGRPRCGRITELAGRSLTGIGSDLGQQRWV